MWQAAERRPRQAVAALQANCSNRRRHCSLGSASKIVLNLEIHAEKGTPYEAERLRNGTILICRFKKKIFKTDLFKET